MGRLTNLRPKNYDAPLTDYGVIAGEAAGDSAAGAVVASGLAAIVASGDAGAAGLPDGAAVSVFCSQAASRAALARMQMYFFIVVVEEPILGQIPIRSKKAFSCPSAFCRPRRIVE